MMIRPLVYVLTSIFSGFIFSTPVISQPLFGNFDTPSGSSGTPITQSLISSVRFSTGDHAISVTSLQVSLRWVFGEEMRESPSTLRFIICDNSNGNPGMQLFSFNEQTIHNSTVQDFTFFPSSAIDLLPNTIYHLRTDHIRGFSAWHATNPWPTNPVAQAGSNIIFEGYRYFNGSSYRDATLTNRFQMNGTITNNSVASEPLTIMLFGSSIVSMICWRSDKAHYSFRLKYGQKSR
jgi:hypothetical protein